MQIFSFSVLDTAMENLRPRSPVHQIHFMREKGSRLQGTDDAANEPLVVGRNLPREINYCT